MTKEIIYMLAEIFVLFDYFRMKIKYKEFSKVEVAVIILTSFVTTIIQIGGK